MGFQFYLNHTVSVLLIGISSGPGGLVGMVSMKNKNLIIDLFLHKPKYCTQREERTLTVHALVDLCTACMNCHVQFSILYLYINSFINCGTVSLVHDLVFYYTPNIHSALAHIILIAYSEPLYITCHITHHCMYLLLISLYIYVALNNGTPN